MGESGRLRSGGGDGKPRLSLIGGLGRTKLGLRPSLSRNVAGETAASWLRSPIRGIPTLTLLLIVLATGALVAFILFPGLRIEPATYRLGDIATENIRATHTFEVEDDAATRKKREAAAAAVPAVYDLDEAWLVDLEERVRAAFSALRERFGTPEIESGGPAEPVPRGGARSAPTLSSTPSLRPNAKLEFEGALGASVSQRDFEALAGQGHDESSPDAVVDLLRILKGEYVVSDSRSLRRGNERGIVVRGLPSRREEEVRDFARILTTREAEDLLSEKSRELLAEFPSSLRSSISRIASGLVTPNLTFNKAETDERAAAAAKSAETVYFRVQKGEMIIREGDPVLPIHIAKIEAMRSDAKQASHGLLTVGVGAMTILLLALGVVFAVGNLKEVEPTGKDLLFLATVVILEVALIKLATFLASSVRENLPLIPLWAYSYAFPFAFGAMLVRLVLNAETALVFSACLAPLCAMAMDNSFFILLYAWVGSLVGIHGVAHCDRRTTVAKAGLGVGGMNFLLIACFALLKGGTWSPAALRDLSFELMGGFAGGLGVAVLVAGVTPIFESLFGYTTDIRLLEFANLDHPLLKEMTLRAPGTYHHSVVLGSMVEAAAKSIGANPLLAQVAAYYHDIGKLSKPHYFIENQESGENPHDRLSPAMSTLILQNHVKEGIDLATKHRLGERLVGLIQQSHGTALIDCFYDRAKNLAPADEPPEETYFRYPGPKPQTREAGLLMLADSVEAASRTLTDWNPARVQGLVQRIVNKKFSDGQLDECEMTLKDLDAIAKSFTKSLAAVYRRRIDYPEPAYKLDTDKKKGPLGPVARESGRGKGRSARTDKDGSDYLKRLGMS